MKNESALYEPNPGPGRTTWLPRRLILRTPVTSFPDILSRDDASKKSNSRRAPGRPSLESNRASPGIVKLAFLRWLCKTANVSQPAIARQTGWSQPSVNKYLMGRETIPSIPRLLMGVHRAHLLDRYKHEQDINDDQMVILDSLQFINELISGRQDVDTQKNEDLLTLVHQGRNVEVPYRYKCQLHRLVFLFDVLKKNQGVFISSLKKKKHKFWKSEEHSRNPYLYNLKFEKLCTVSWFPRFPKMKNWARVEFFGRAIEKGTAAPFLLEHVLPFARPHSLELTRADFATDYLTTSRLSPLLVPFDSKVRTWKLQRPQCPFWHPRALNTLHGSRTSPSSILDYEKDIEKLCRECLRASGSYFSRDYPADCVECLHNKIDPHVHRSEARVKPASRTNRSLDGLMFWVPNPYESHSLIHLGLAPDLPTLLVLFAGRLLGLREFQKELQGQCRNHNEKKMFKEEFQKLVDEMTDVTSSVLAQPRQVFDANREELQRQLDSFLGILSDGFECQIPTQPSTWDDYCLEEDEVPYCPVPEVPSALPVPPPPAPCSQCPQPPAWWQPPGKPMFEVVLPCQGQVASGDNRR